MTTPHQRAPDGAYVIDQGGGETNYGQGMTEKGAASLMTAGFTSINLGDPLGAVAKVATIISDTLFSLPLEVLQLFEGLIPGDLGDAFGSVTGAIGAIVNHLQSLGPLLASSFKGFLEVSYNVLESAFSQIMDIVQGLVVTPINGAVAGFKDWFTGLMGGTIPDLGTAVAGAVDAAEGAVADVADLLHDLLTTPASVLGNIPQTLVTGLGGALGTLTSGLSSVNGVIQNLIDAIISALRRVPFVGGSLANIIEDLGDFKENTEAAVVNGQNAVISVITESGGVNQRWMAPYAVADFTYPEIMNSSWAIQGITTTASAGTAHTHQIFGTSGVQSGNFAYAPIWNFGLNQRIGGSITTRSSIVYDTVAMYLGKTGSINNVYVEVLRENSDGSLVQVSSQEVSASITNPNGAYCEFTLPSPLIAVAGEKYIVSMRDASSTGFRARSRVMAAQAEMGFLVTGTDAAKTSYTSSEATTFRSAPMPAGSGDLFLVPWAMLATKNGVADDKSYSDDFNRSSLGSLWSLTSNTGSFQLGIYPDGRAGFDGSTNGDQVGLYIKPVSTDQMLVEANLYNRAASPRLGVMSCCNRELTQVVYLGANNGTVNIYTGAWNSLTQRKSVAAFNDAKFGLYSDPTASAGPTFTILKDGTDIGSWVDTGGVVTFDANHRFGGIRSSKASGIDAGRMDNWTLRDAVL